MYINSGKRLAGKFQGIYFQICLMEYLLWNPETDNITKTIYGIIISPDTTGNNVFEYQSGGI